MYHPTKKRSSNVSRLCELIKRGYKSPTIHVLSICVGMFIVREYTAISLAFSFPLFQQPWTLITAVYAHASLSHLLSNIIAIAIFGIGLEQITTPRRFHLFFYLVGLISMLSFSIRNLIVAERIIPVLGASGSMLAMFSYLAVANPLGHRFIAWVDPSKWIQIVVFTSLSALIAILGATPRGAVTAHFTGLLLGIAAGRLRILTS